MTQGSELNSQPDPYTLLETNVETQKRPYKDYSPSKMGLHGFPCWFGGVSALI